MSLNIEQLTEQVEMDKTAEDAYLEKVAEEANVIGQAQTLTAIGDEFFKLAEATDEEVFALIGADLHDIGARMGATLVKTASDSNEAMNEALEIAEDLNKLASVIAEVAEQVDEEEFNELASPVVEIANEMTEDANEVIEKEAASGKSSTWADFKSGLKGEKAREAWKSIKKYKKSELNASGRAKRGAVAMVGRGSKATAMEKLKVLVGTSSGRKALMPALKAYGTVGGAAAVLGGAGYAAKRYHDKK